MGWGSQGPECLQACRISHVVQGSRDTGLCVARAGCWWLCMVLCSGKIRLRPPGVYSVGHFVLLA